MAALQQAGTQTVPLFHDRLRPARQPAPEQIARWLADLDHEDYALREQATHDLENHIEWVTAALQKRWSPSRRRR